MEAQLRTDGCTLLHWVSLFFFLPVAWQEPSGSPSSGGYLRCPGSEVHVWLRSHKAHFGQVLPDASGGSPGGIWTQTTTSLPASLLFLRSSRLKAFRRIFTSDFGRGLPVGPCSLLVSSSLRSSEHLNPFPTRFSKSGGVNWITSLKLKCPLRACLKPNISSSSVMA